MSNDKNITKVPYLFIILTAKGSQLPSGRAGRSADYIFIVSDITHIYNSHEGCQNQFYLRPTSFNVVACRQLKVQGIKLDDMVKNAQDMIM